MGRLMVFREIDIKKKLVSLLFIGMGLFSSCKDQTITEFDKSLAIPNDLTIEDLLDNSQEEYQLLGRRGKIVFPDRTAEVEYVDAFNMHWKTADENNTILEGTEKINYTQISEHIFFVNWIEEDGFTVSQTIDTKTGDVNAYWSFNDSTSSRSKRSSVFVKGKFEFGE